MTSTSSARQPSQHKGTKPVADWWQLPEPWKWFPKWPGLNILTQLHWFRVFFFFFNLNNNNKTTAKPQHNNFLYILELHYIFIRFLELQPTISGFFGLLEFSSVSFRSGKVHLQDFNISIYMFHCQIWLS